MIPQPYPVTSEAIASYDYLDFASGFGYRKLYLCGGSNATSGTGSAVYFLTPETLGADKDVNKLTGAGTTNFDIQFRNPVVIHGRALLKTIQQATGGTTSFYVDWVLKKVAADGTITTLGTIGTANITANTIQTKAAYIDAIPNTAFSPNDILRLAVTITVGGSGGSAYVYTDPSGRVVLTETGTGASIGSSSYIAIPFAVDLE